MRIDLWLHVARFFKTRALAAAAVAGGKVELNGQKTKPAKLVRIGDELHVRVGAYEHHIHVLGLARHRGPASTAATLYRETPESRLARERLAEQHRLAAALTGAVSSGRPTKRDRRDLEKLKGER